MAKTIGIYGASDDRVEIEIDGKPFEELPAYRKGRSFVFRAAGKALYVDVRHGARGWQITTAIGDETEEGALPFGVRIEQRAYSPLLLVEVAGDAVTFTWWSDGEPQTKTVYP